MQGLSTNHPLGLSPARYVVLCHAMPADSNHATHWDFMLQAGEVLRTWALAEPPRGGATILADALADHRLAYLTYEGPVSNDRGTVSRWDAGTYELLHQTAEKIQVRLVGQQLQGLAALEKGADQRWTFSLVSDSSRA